MTRSWILVAVFVVGVVTLPRQVASTGWSASFHDDRSRAEELARGVDEWVEKPGEFSTGSSRFDGEWSFGTYLMAALGHGQVGVRHLELASSSRTSMEGE